MIILFKYATRGRPKLFVETLEKYYSMLSGKHSCYFIISMDENDRSMNNDLMKCYLDGKDNLFYYFNPPASKIAAINANMEGTYFDVLFVVSDDMIPQVKGFDDIIARDMQKHFPGMDGALHYDDGIQHQNLITFSIMGCELYKQIGYIYHPEYESQWCDNEFTEVVRKMDRYIWIPRMIVRHAWKAHGNDQTYAVSDANFQKDRAVYLRRRAAGFAEPIKI